MASGRWVRVRRGAYVDAPGPGADPFAVERQHALARVAAVAGTLRDGAVLCRDSAALVHRVPLLRPPARVHVAQGVSASSRAARDVARHVVPVPPDDVTVIGGLVTTSLERTVVDCARTLGVAGGLVVVDAALARGADPGWPEHGVLLEYDGRAKYAAAGGTVDAVLAEKRREEALVEAGYVVVRVTHEDLARPQVLRRRLRRVLPADAFGHVVDPVLRRP